MAQRIPGEDPSSYGPQQPHPPHQRGPVLRRSRGEFASDVSDRLTYLTHELAGLLDGSLRTLALARRASPERAATVAPDDLERRLAAVEAALQRMAQVLDTVAVTGRYAHGERMREAAGVGGTIGDVANHVAEVLRAGALERRVQILVELPPAVERLDAGPLYPALLNGVRNAIEAIEQVEGPGEPKGGTVRITGRTERAGEGDQVVLEVIDDGIGPVGRDDPFRFGVSTKPAHGGLGLAIAADVIAELDGTIELVRRDAPAVGSRRGAVLRMRFPAVASAGPQRMLPPAPGAGPPPPPRSGPGGEHV